MANYLGEASKFDAYSVMVGGTPSDSGVYFDLSLAPPGSPFNSIWNGSYWIKLDKVSTWTGTVWKPLKGQQIWDGASWVTL